METDDDFNAVTWSLAAKLAHRLWSSIDLKIVLLSDIKMKHDSDVHSSASDG